MTVSAPEAQNRTAQFARVLGPFLAIACAAAVLDTPHREPLYAALTDSALWLWALGVFGLLCGLTVVAFHQLWHSPAAMVISAFGWLVIIRSILLLAFPTFVADRVDLSMGGSTTLAGRTPRIRSNGRLPGSCRLLRRIEDFGLAEADPTALIERAPTGDAA